MISPEVIKEAQKGSAAAQESLFQSLYKPMHHVCYRYLRNKEDSEECLLSGFCIFFRKLRHFSYTSDEALTCWVRKIMIIECLMFLRGKKVFDMVTESEAAEVTIPDEVFDKFSTGEIYNLITQMPAGYRAVMNLHIDGYSHQEIADKLNVTIGTSHNQLNKARILLKKMLLENENHYATEKTK